MIDKCSFCRKSAADLRVLIKARDGHAICDACVKNARMVLESFAAPDDAPAPIEKTAKVVDFVTARGLILAKRGEL